MGVFTNIVLYSSSIPYLMFCLVPFISILLWSIINPYPLHNWVRQNCRTNKQYNKGPRKQQEEFVANVKKHVLNILQQ